MLASPRLSGTAYSRTSSGRNGSAPQSRDRESWRSSYFRTARGSASPVSEGPGGYPATTEQGIILPAQQRLPSVSRSRLMQYGGRAVSPAGGASPRATPEPATLLRPPVRSVAASSPPFPGGRGSIGHPRGLFACVSHSEAPLTSPRVGVSSYYHPVQKNSSFISRPLAHDFEKPEPYSATRSARKRGRPASQDVDRGREESPSSGARSQAAPQVSLSRREAAKGWVLSTLSRIPLVGSLVSGSQEGEEQDTAKPSLSAGTEGGRDSHPPKADGLLALAEPNALLARSHASLASPHTGKYRGGKCVRDAAELASNCKRSAANFPMMTGCHAGTRTLGGSPKCVRPSVLSSQGIEPSKDELLEWETPARKSLRSPTAPTAKVSSALARLHPGHPRFSHTVLEKGERGETESDDVEEEQGEAPETEATRDGESPFFSSPLDHPPQWRSPMRLPCLATSNSAVRYQPTRLPQYQEQQQEHQRVLSSLPVYASADEWQKDLDYILCMRDKFQLPPVASDLTMESGPGSLGGRETSCPTAKRARRGVPSGHRAVNPSLLWDPLWAVASAVTSHHVPSGSEYRLRTPSFQTGPARWGSSGTGVTEITGSSMQNPFAMYNGSHQRRLQDGSLLTFDKAFYGSRHRQKHRALRATDYRRLLRQAKFHSCKWIDYFDYVKARTADVEDYHHFTATATHKRVAMSMAEEDANSNNRSSPYDSTSVTPGRRGSLLVADLPPPATAHRSLTFLDSQLQHKEHTNLRPSPTPPEITSAPSEDSLSLGIDREKKPVQQNSKPDGTKEARLCEGAHSQAPSTSREARVLKSSGSSEKSEASVPWWKANLGKPIQVSVEEDGFADNAQDEQTSFSKPANAASSIATVLEGPTTSGTALLSEGLLRTGSSEGSTNTFLFKPAIAGGTETPRAAGSSSGVLSASPPEAAFSGHLSAVDASGKKPRASGALSPTSSSSSPVFIFGKPCAASPKPAPSPVSDNTKRPSSTLGTSTAVFSHSSDGSPLRKKQSSSPASSSLFTADPALSRGSLFADGGKARISSADQSSAVCSLFGQSEADTAIKTSSGVISAAHKTGTPPSTSLFGSRSGPLTETNKPTTVTAPPPQTTSLALFTSGSAGPQKASGVSSSSTCSSLFAPGSSQLDSNKALPAASSPSTISSGTAQDQQKKPSSLLMPPSLFSTTTQQPTESTPSSSAPAQTPFLFGSTSSSNATNGKSQPVPASPSLFGAPSSSTENPPRDSTVNGPSTALTLSTSGTHTGTSDNRGFGLFEATNLTAPKTSLFGTTTGSVFSAPEFANTSTPQRTGLTDSTTTVAPQQPPSSGGITGSSVLPSGSSFLGSGLSGRTTFGSGTQQMVSSTGVLGGGGGGGYSADSQTNPSSTATNIASNGSPFATFGSRGSQQNGAESTLPSPSTGSTLFGSVCQSATGSAGLFGVGGANTGSHSITAPSTSSPATATQPSILPSLFGPPSSLSTSPSTGSGSILQHLSGPSSSSSSSSSALLQKSASIPSSSTVPPASSSPFTFGATSANASPFGTGASVVASPSTSTLFGTTPSQAATTGTPVDSSSTQLAAAPFSFGATSAATNQDAASGSSSSVTSGPGNHNPFAANAGSFSGATQRRPKIRLKRTLH